MEKDQLQSLKIEISKNTQLLAYERIAFHKILGILKTENGMKIMLRDINKESIVRESAISELKEFNNTIVTQSLIEILNEEINKTEKIYIFEHLERYGRPENCSVIIDFIEAHKEDLEDVDLIKRAFNCLRILGEGENLVLEYLLSIAQNTIYDDILRTMAIISLSSFKGVSIWYELFQEEKEDITYAVFKAISILCDNLAEKAEYSRSKEDEIFTYTPEHEDKVMLDIRVLLGKMTASFDSYSNRVKIVFINSLISSNHREILIYIMKGLASNDSELRGMVFDILLSNIERVRDPDKLFRNLLSLSVDSKKEGKAIVDIFERYFSNIKENRNTLILKDKLYNYIVVTLETCFESYRKEFMITDVIEKNFPEVFRKVRSFVLEKLTPGLKNRIVNYLRQKDDLNVQKIIIEISEKVSYIEDEEGEGLYCLIEVLFDKDEKSREVSASRIDDINFEKRYLRDRIVRLCDIIGKLMIHDAASTLVVIYNYVKKYSDPILFDATAYALSMLNYSYMLGELEVLLTTGDKSDQENTVEYISLYSDQRALNIVLDFLKDKIEEDSEILIKFLKILLRLDITGNESSRDISKKIIELNHNTEIKSLAIISLGKVGNESDLSFLNDLFFSLKENEIKISIVIAIGYIINNSRDLNKRQMIKQLREYLKESGIRVRIYSCLLLIQLGDRTAMKLIMDMMTIKNKNIQREILSVFGRQKSVEFSYFLLSLLKDEYAITSDIVQILKLLPQDELKEIDHFIVNIYRKHEGIDIEYDKKIKIDRSPRIVKGLEEHNISIIDIDIINFKRIMGGTNIIELSISFKDILDIIILEIINNKGTIVRITEGRIMSYFKDPLMASNVILNISKNITNFNKQRLPAGRLELLVKIVTDKVKLINEEIINYHEFRREHFNTLSIFKNRIYVDDNTMNLLSENYYTEIQPEIVFKKNESEGTFFELISPVNMILLSEDILRRLREEEKERLQKEIDLEAEMKKRKGDRRSPTAIAYAQALDDIGRILKNDLYEIDKFVEKRTTDRELISNVHKMLDNAYKRFFVEKSKMFLE
ncbi:MAG: hypothetical protein SVR08_05200 [Spirochaetota bacterium]|nr:hypothetical protein [Spirochaetota bacterium]